MTLPDHHCARAVGPLRAARAALIVLFVLLVAPSAHAQQLEFEPELLPEDVPEVSFLGWTGALEVAFTAFEYEFTAAATNITESITVGNDDARDQYLIRVGAELMGPSLLEGFPGDPRLSLHGGVALPILPNHGLIQSGDPDFPNQPELGIERYRAIGPFGLVLPGDFLGQGSRIEAEFVPSFYAGLGVAFQAPIARDVVVLLKPGIQYSAERIDFSGKLTTVFEPPPPGVDPPSGPFTRQFQILRSNVGASTTDHRLGPMLEFAVTFWNGRPFRGSIFAQTEFLWLLSDATIRWGDAIASYRVERRDFGVSAGGGLRLRWVGFR